MAVKGKKPGFSKLIAKNKKAFFDYEVLDKMEAGIILTGPEVKSAKDGRVQLKGAFVKMRQKKVVVENLHISAYRYSNVAEYNPLRVRELLLTKSEIEIIAAKTEEKGLTVVPLELNLKNNLVKLTIGICRGKKLHDKRDVLKKKAITRDVQAGLKKLSR